MLALIRLSQNVIITAGSFQFNARLYLKLSHHVIIIWGFWFTQCYYLILCSYHIVIITAGIFTMEWRPTTSQAERTCP